MKVMRIAIAPAASGLIQQRVSELVHDQSLPQSVRGMINVHMSKAWIPGFWSVAIRAPKPESDLLALKSYFDFPIGTAEDGATWFFPSREWWVAHANASHPPAGSGCDVAVHTNYLSSEGSVHEFDYATIYADGQMKVLGPGDFSEECMWWGRAFPNGMPSKP